MLSAADSAQLVHKAGKRIVSLGPILIINW
jgi:hypothetical protein